MKSRMRVAVCSDGRKRNVLIKLSLPQQIEAFWKKVDVSGKDNCWMWRAAVCGSKSKYGHVVFQGRLQKAHRVSYELSIGPIPKGMIACHKCDNSLCVNPHHIFIGTQQDNMRDMWSKGRGVHTPLLGEDNPRTKITPAQAIEVRRLWDDGDRTQREISIATGVSVTNVGAIVQRRTWNHI